ncbi:MAG: hypothetical protein ACKO34_00155 [Vampirovibrionales bacterium]
MIASTASPPSFSLWGSASPTTAPKASVLPTIRDTAQASPSLDTKASPPTQETLPAWHPAQWNIALGIPAVGVVSNLLWGTTAFARKHLDTQGSYLFPGAKQLIQAEPLINTVYGLSNAAAALTQGYAFRSLAFGLYSSITLAMAPLLHRYNHSLIQVMENQESLPKKALQTALKLKPHVWILDAVAPMAVLASLYATTKVAQSTPNLTLQHPQGSTWNELQTQPAADQKLTTALKANLHTEAQQTKAFLTHPLQTTRRALAGLKQAVFPKPTTSNASTPPKKESVQDRLNLTPFTAWCYLNQAVGTLAFSSIAVGLYALAHNNPKVLTQLRDKSKLDELALKAKGVVTKDLIKAPATADTAVNTVGKKVLDSVLPWANIAATAAIATTNFGDWPSGLSAVYRLGAIPFAISSVGALANLAGFNKKDYGIWLQHGKVFGVDGVTWSKIGTFVTGTSYLGNLLLKSMNTPKETPKAPANEPC